MSSQQDPEILQQQREATTSNQGAVSRVGQLCQLGASELCGTAVNQASRLAELHKVPHCSTGKQLSGTLPQQSGWRVRVGFLRRHMEGTPRTGRAAENRLSGDVKPSPSVPAQCKCNDPASYS